MEATLGDLGFLQMQASSYSSLEAETSGTVLDRLQDTHRAPIEDGSSLFSPFPSSSAPPIPLL